MHWFGDHLGLGDRGRIEGGSAPGNIHRQPRKIDNATISTVAAQVVCGAHKDAIYRTWFDAKSTKHALRIVDCIACDFKALASFDFFFANVNAVDWACFGALITSDASRQVEAVKAAVTCCDRYGFFRILELLRECAAIGKICRKPVTQCHVHSVNNGAYGNEYIPKPLKHLVVYPVGSIHWIEL